MQYSSKFQSLLIKATVPPLWHFGVFFFFFFLLVVVVTLIY